MRLPTRGEVLGVAAGLATIGVTAGCGRSSHSPSAESTTTQSPNSLPLGKAQKGPAAGSKPFRGILQCAAIQPQKEWIPTPSNIRAPEIAAQLGHGITAGQVLAGEMGPANCTPAIEATQVGNAIAAIHGIGNVCLVIGLGSLPVPGKTYNKVLAVCAAPASSAPATLS